MFVQGSHTFAMFHAHALRQGRGHAHTNVTITRYAKNWSVDQSGQVIFDAKSGQNVKHQCCIKVIGHFLRSMETCKRRMCLLDQCGHLHVNR